MCRYSRHMLGLIGIVSLAVLCLSFYGCGSGQQPPADLSTRVTVAQGIWGQVLFHSGDFSPGGRGGSVTPVRRTIYVYEPTRISQVQEDGYGGFYRAIQTRQAATTESDEDGFFQLALPPGRYSLFVREGDRFYADRWDHDGTIFPVEVQEGTVKKVPVGITYAAYQ